MLALHQDFLTRPVTPSLYESMYTHMDKEDFSIFTHTYLHIKGVFKKHFTVLGAFLDQNIGRATALLDSLFRYK